MPQIPSADPAHSTASRQRSIRPRESPHRPHQSGARLFPIPLGSSANRLAVVASAAILDDHARQTLELFRRHGVKPQLWVTGCEAGDAWVAFALPG